MRKQLLSTVATIAIAAAISGPVSAADMQPIRKAPPMIESPTWAGWYVGGHVGYGGVSFRGYDPLHEFSSSIPTKANASGLALGLHTGYNWQSGNWVYGIEGDATITPGWQKRVCLDTVCETGIDGRLHWLGTMRARLGWTFDRTLIYATGGVAWAARQITFNTSLATPADGRPVRVKTGGVVGGGIEWKYNPTLSIRLEGLQYIFNEKKTLLDDTAVAVQGGVRSASVIRLGLSWFPKPY